MESREAQEVRDHAMVSVREIVAIVVGILLALAVDTGWERRQDRKLEAELLEDIAAEVRVNLQALQRATDRQRMRIQRISILLGDAEEPQSVIGIDSLRSLDRVYFTSNFNPRTGVIRELIASGDMRVIRSRELRQRLAGFEESIAPYLGNAASLGQRFLDPTRDPVGPAEWANRPLSRNTRENLNYFRWVRDITILLVAQSEGVAEELEAILTLTGG